MTPQQEQQARAEFEARAINILGNPAYRCAITGAYIDPQINKMWEEWGCSMLDDQTESNKQK